MAGRYPNLSLQAVLPHQVRHLVDTDAGPEWVSAELALCSAGLQEPPGPRRAYQPAPAAALLRWCRRRLQPLHIELADLDTGLRSGQPRGEGW